MMSHFAVPEDERVVDAHFAKGRQNAGLKKERIFGLGKLVEREHGELPQFLHIASEVSLEGLMAAHNTLEAHKNRIRLIVALD